MPLRSQRTGISIKDHEKHVREHSDPADRPPPWRRLSEAKNSAVSEKHVREHSDPAERPPPWRRLSEAKNGAVSENMSGSDCEPALCAAPAEAPEPELGPGEG